ncbi:hypothetical protein TVAG_093860 [Trichomonas vaginalis G3]|uniref:Uncharacterized protein n=1 Tax=Trichomonas vaginalis (strain ATCC PRA-98 / G3) TaxID=412133 RepID=A2DBK9_TRIV3|nr:hypothetical protein TVAGG3_0381840 [Trichomonas vaginalis G3]EAY22212.1 hypothetical protein TVAG_093860 [Trichomonas vaginalis G3]KAI5533329.1 hypothetical protein TVAGG3_0381840 [Trichomonas vaginalis G3]|eukprot:XP_001583198.1 hypothetical protein [Trichomonas vaginalis G3]
MSKSEEFHWRGGDVLKEKEYIDAEYKKSITEYRKNLMIKNSLEKELEAATADLEEKQGYSNALQSFMNGTEQGGKEYELKQKLDQIHSEIQQKSAELATMSECQNPAAVAALSKENATLLIEGQRNAKLIANSDAQTDTIIRQLAACTISDPYQYACQLDISMIRESRHKTVLRQLVSSLKGSFDMSQKIMPSKTDYSQKLRDHFTDSITLKAAMKDAHFNYRYDVEDHNMHIKALISHIDELNSRLEDLKLQDYVISIDELNQQFQPKKPTEATSEEVEERRNNKKERHENLLQEDKKRQADAENAAKREKREADRKRREELKQAEEKREEERRKDLEKYQARKRAEEEHQRKLKLSGPFGQKKKPSTTENKSTKITPSTTIKEKVEEFVDDENENNEEDKPKEEKTENVDDGDDAQVEIGSESDE